MAHERIDVPGRRWRAPGRELRRHDDIEVLSRVQEVAAVLQAFGGVKERAASDTEGLRRLDAGKDHPSGGKQAGHIGGQG